MVNKFKVGDRVTNTSIGAYSYIRLGERGVITGVINARNELYEVEFPFFYTGDKHATLDRLSWFADELEHIK